MTITSITCLTKENSFQNESDSMLHKSIDPKGNDEFSFPPRNYIFVEDKTKKNEGSTASYLKSLIKVSDVSFSCMPS